ncbi:sensor histidine kinase KdpD [uncultured Bacteroides sp.]|uniref:sensor histidine kinase n=1 Tax=uncultured Bacteroides sp. TaxID=162156 RepID=UPI0025F8D564|nr:HAMP domain-containing sensor histidine kinase [uncultured Bacteroides sp.]
MSRHFSLITIFFCLIFVLQMKAQQPTEFDSDSVPPVFSTLKEKLYSPTEFYPLWYKMKQDIEAKEGDKTQELYYLYKYKVSYHNLHCETDSLEKYIPVFRELCLKVGDLYHYYESWDLLCDIMLFSNSDEESIAEHQKMQEDATRRNNEIGLAFSTSRIGTNYATRREWGKAKYYFEQSMKVFEDMKLWDEYIMLTSNYITTLLHLGEKQKALSSFQHLDSIANSFIKENNIDKYGRRIVVIKGMALEVYSDLYKSPEDTLIMKKYLDETESWFWKVPNMPVSYLYNSRINYARITNNLPQLVAYQDSLAQYNIKTGNMVELLDVYGNMSENLYAVHRYKDAYLVLRKYVSLNDSVYKTNFQKQLNEMSTRYNVNKLELEAQKARMDARNTQYYYACALITILAIALLISIRFYLHKLKSNRLLTKQAQELVLANEKVQKAQLVKTAFIQNMNHEIRTPLNAIVGFSECLAQIPMEPEDIQEMSATIKKNSDQLLKIISDTISIANIDSEDSILNCQPVSINGFCSELIIEMQKYAQPGVNLYYTPGETDYSLNTDKNTVSQILNNLLHNALKFTQSGEVEVSYEVDSSGNELRMYVRDTGPGVSSELKEAIFERFYKIDTFMQGAGLGLSLCRILAERLGARVYLDDSYHEGCLFVFAHPIR